MSAATVLSDYVVTDELLGEGALSTVRLAQNLSTGKPVAVKIIPKKDLTLFEKETVFIECEVLKILNHDHIVKLLDFYEDKENYYVFLQYIAGGNLHDFLRRTGKLQQERALWMVQQLMKSLSHCHDRFLVHRDLKLENVLVDENLSVFLADFGLAMDVSKSNGLVFSFGGTPLYSAPEIQMRKPHDGRKADVWALGVLLVGLLFGEQNLLSLPRQKDTLRFIGSLSSRMGLSPMTFDLLEKMFQQDPSKRWSLFQLLQHPVFDEVSPAREAYFETSDDD